MVYLISILLQLSAFAGIDRLTTEEYLGEKRLDSYSGVYQPLIYQDVYQGKLSFQDDLFFENFFNIYIFPEENEFSTFLKSELNGGVNCPNSTLSEHFDEIRFAYRLITLSYLLEGQWHLKTLSDHLHQKNGCAFNLEKWLGSCKPKSSEMKKFMSRLLDYKPTYLEPLPKTYDHSSWQKDFKTTNYQWYSHYRMENVCPGDCDQKSLEMQLASSCSTDQEVMTLICSEQDEIYGLSSFRDAYYLLGQSNITNTYNKNGQALGCLRRFSEVMSHKEVRYEVLKTLFPSIQSYLRQKYQERFLQGRVFIYGSSKEFEDKGVKNLFVKEASPTISHVKPVELKPTPAVVEGNLPPPLMKILPEKKPEPQVKANPKTEVAKVLKSAFLQAAEVRKGQDLDKVEVDMLKLKYDYVFTLNMINNLTEKLKSFQTREALKEMMMYDKLGTKEGPVPFLFIKYLIDMEEHQGLYNIISILGERFYVSNEIDANFNPDIEMIELSKEEMGSRNWKIFVVKP